MKKTALLAALFAVTATVGATDVGQHPAIFSPRSLPGIDASTFIVGHPAGGATGKAEQAELAHPAAATPRAGSHAHIGSPITSRTNASLQAGSIQAFSTSSMKKL